jgi:hypothetical protein
MSFIFIAAGGSGTTYFLQSLCKKYKVDAKPDTYLVKKGEPFSPKKGQYHQAVSDLYDYPSSGAIVGFRERSGFKLDSQQTINDNILNYIEHLKQSNRKVLFNSLYKFAFFRNNAIKGVTALIRHPLHAYLSYAKKKRHQNLINHYGGVNSEEAINFYAHAWNRIVDESSIVLRFEYFYEDISKIEMEKNVFKKWDSTKRNENILTKKSTKILFDKVKNNYLKHYDTWEV